MTMAAMKRDEVTKHLRISDENLGLLIANSLIITDQDGNFPMFQFNREALDLEVIVAYRILLNSALSNEEIVEWFVSHNVILDTVPFEYIKFNGGDELVRAAVVSAVDIASL